MEYDAHVDDMRIYMDFVNYADFIISGVIINLATVVAYTFSINCSFLNAEFKETSNLGDPANSVISIAMLFKNTESLIPLRSSV
jgi:hypothetical protein